MTAKKRAIITTAAALVILAAVAVPLSLYFTGIIAMPNRRAAIRIPRI